MESKTIKVPYEEPRIITAFFKDADVIVTSGTGSGSTPEDDWGNTPSQGWV